ncbi:MAG: hypothetical protein JSU70_04050 [Phycisphaerales bacterium]|nr:MAG: hypothetical protein JSU70_04050 [Phycisphaerales bacterium]
MRTRKRVVPFLIFLPLTLSMLGCASSQGELDGILPSDTTDAKPGDSVARRFQEPTEQDRTAVESAIELSQRYASLSEQASELRNKNKDLVTENDDLKKQLAELDGKLKQTQKELAEANSLLIEMLTELNNWKTNILGFRNEMREAEKAQLEALLKILETLGGEIEAQPTEEETTRAPTPPAIEPEKLEP